MSLYSSCHNSRQGRKLVTDDSGAMCARTQTHKNGCCKTQQRIEQVITHTTEKGKGRGDGEMEEKILHIDLVCSSHLSFSCLFSFCSSLF
jgi:hypothetical protein